ncbi:MAG: hypothetical protein ACRC10_12250 [Thermoguttaceae bacterium]
MHLTREGGFWQVSVDVPDSTKAGTNTQSVPYFTLKSRKKKVVQRKVCLAEEPE